MCRRKADYEQVESIKITVYFNSVVRDASVFFVRKTQNEREKERERQRVARPEGEEREKHWSGMKR